MRFEIRGGGMAAIIIGIAALSGTVFMLGLLAGYDVGRESQSSQAEVATAYPLESPPASAATPAEAAAPAATSSIAAVHELPPPPAAAATPVATARTTIPKHSRPPARTASAAVATPGTNADEAPPPSGEVTIPSRAGASHHPTESANEIDTEAPPAAAPTPRTSPPAVASAHLPPRRRPYNIQIEAVMDRTGANVMVYRLQNLGYSPHIVPTQVAGQTWYKVEVGPYASEDEAAAAQQQLRAKYNSVYGGANRAD
jgi:cell division septation protein DedD